MGFKIFYIFVHLSPASGHELLKNSKVQRCLGSLGAWRRRTDGVLNFLERYMITNPSGFDYHCTIKQLGGGVTFQIREAIPLYPLPGKTQAYVPPPS